MTNQGQVVTCYSYKGGVGRSFALANIAALLAQWNLRVLCIDWDLEAPGLDYYFGANDTDRPGLLELMQAVASDTSIDPSEYAFPVSLQGRLESSPSEFSIDLLSAGRPHQSYARRVQAIDWDALYSEHDLGSLLEEWRASWQRSYDVILIDSRTGVTDIGGICTAQLPDILLLFFTANHQGIEGVLKVCDQALDARNNLPFDRAHLLTVPVPSRFDQGVEYKRSETWRQVFLTSFADCYQDWVAQGVELETVISRTTIPYSAYWSFGEELAALSENHRDPTYITHPLATVAALLVHRLDKTEVLAASLDSFVDSATRIGNRRHGFDYDVFISSTTQTRDVAGKLGQMLARAGLRVAPDSSARPDAAWNDRTQRQLDDSQHVVFILGDKSSGWQQREATYVLRQTIDESSDRRLIPIATSEESMSNAPSVLRSYQSYDLRSGSIEDAAQYISKISYDTRGDA